MRFPNATKGIKRIFLAEILALVAALILGVTSMVVPAAAAEGLSAVYVFLLAAASVLSIVAFVLNIVGISNAQKDDDNFKMALVCAVVGIVLSVVGAFFQNNVDVSRRLNSAVTIVQLFTSYFVLTGIMSLASQLNDSATGKKAQTSRAWLIGTFLASMVSGYAVALMAKNGTNGLIVVGLLNIVLQLVTFIIYLRALAAGRNMMVSKN